MGLDKDDIKKWIKDRYIKESKNPIANKSFGNLKVTFTSLLNTEHVLRKSNIYQLLNLNEREILGKIRAMTGDNTAIINPTRMDILKIEMCQFKLKFMEDIKKSMNMFLLQNNPEQRLESDSRDEEPDEIKSMYNGKDNIDNCIQEFEEEEEERRDIFDLLADEEDRKEEEKKREEFLEFARMDLQDEEEKEEEEFEDERVTYDVSDDEEEILIDSNLDQKQKRELRIQNNDIQMRNIDRNKRRQSLQAAALLVKQQALEAEKEAKEKSEKAAALQVAQLAQNQANDAAAAQNAANATAAANAAIAATNAATATTTATTSN